MPSTESLMEMFATLILFALVAMLLLRIFNGVGEGEVAMGYAYPITQKIAFRINTLSASPQNETALLKIDPFKYRINFDVTNNYVECETDFFGSAKYGLFLFKDIHLVAPPTIDCITTDCLEKTLLMEKKVYGDGTVEITVGELP